jgi:flagellar basal-body rod protein FlgF
MIDALLTTQRAMDIDKLRLQTISHNISNMNTPGFKKQAFEVQEFSNQLVPPMSALIHAYTPQFVMTQGALNQTHRQHDLAISGDGYFQVQGESGVMYTRRGDFHINPDGALALASGEVLLGQGGVIQVDDKEFTINTQGEVLIEHHKTDEIHCVAIDKESLRSVGNGLYESDASPNPQSNTTRILQGFIEQSNVKSVDEMMELVKTSRHFETTQRIMRTADMLLSAAINQLGESNV